jgi:hypothetical protein
MNETRKYVDFFVPWSGDVSAIDSNGYPL